MQETPNLKLKKPDLTDYVNVGDLNENADIIDEAINENKERLATHLADDASLTKKGHVQLSNATNSTSNALAATPSAVKAAMDRANEAFTSASNGKQAVGSAITGVDPNVTIPTEPTFTELVTAIGQISTGKKWASGSFPPIKAYYSGYDFVVESLDFIPKYILASALASPNRDMSRGIESFSFYKEGKAESTQNSYSNISVPIVEGNGFRIRAAHNDANFVAIDWIAFE